MTTGAVLAAAAVATAGCGSSDDSSSGPPPQPRPTASAADFPAAKGDDAPGPAGLRLGGADPRPRGQPPRTAGRRRTASGSPSSTRRASSSPAPRSRSTPRAATARALRGPFVARDESLAVKPAFESRTTAADPDAAKAIYVADLPFAKGGKPVVTRAGAARRPPRAHERLLRAGRREGRASRPARGPRPSAIHTPTLASRRRGRLEDRHPHPAGDRPAQDRLRRRRRQEAGRPDLRHAAAVPEPRLRPGRRRRRAGRGPRRRPTSPSSTRRSTRTTRSTRA